MFIRPRHELCLEMLVEQHCLGLVQAPTRLLYSKLKSLRRTRLGSFSQLASMERDPQLRPPNGAKGLLGRWASHMGRKAKQPMKTGPEAPPWDVDNSVQSYCQE